jgi:hypothetical protein
VKTTENPSLFSELTAEEAMTINGASHYYSRNSRRNSRYIYSSRRQNCYQEEYSRRYRYRHNQARVVFSVIVGF